MQARSTLTATAQPGANPKPFLVVLGPGLFTTYELPAQGSFIVGRRPGTEVWVDDGLMSSEHVRISVEDGCSVEDLGSTNGTYLRGERLQPGRRHALPWGEAVGIGSCLLVIQATSPAPPSRRAVSYGFLRIRLDEELARAAVDPARRFSLARLQVLSPTPMAAVCHTASEVLRPFDTLSVYAADEYAVLFAQTPHEEARQLLALLYETMAARGSTVRCGIACYPDNGRTALELEAQCARVLRPALSSETDSNVAAESPAMRELYRYAERAARSQISLLITGETGAGKDMLARWVHAHSPRARGPFQAINCAALPEALLESQLFGYERGAFTGATRSQKGLLEAAEGGTVFLDEIAEVPLGVQAKLLRLLDNGEMQVVGSSRPQRVNVRFVAATNVDLVRAVAEQRFRADLLYRLKGFELRLPPLRARREDILPLSRSMLARFSAVEGLERVPSLSPEAVACLLAHPWPGNVRELGNTLHRALVLSDHQLITPDELFLNDDASSDPAGTEEPTERPVEETTKLSRRVSNPSRHRVVDTLSECGGNQRRAAELLGIPRKRLRELIVSYDLPLPRARS